MTGWLKMISFYIPQLTIVFNYEKKKQSNIYKIISLSISLKNIMLENNEEYQIDF